jgi:uncharacterized repeat protein (TIGR01451 family)
MSANRVFQRTSAGRLAERRPQHALLSSLPLAVLLVLAFGGGSASAAAAAPGWTIESLAKPSNFSVAGGGSYVVTATNAGSVATSGQITLTDALPSGLTAQSVDLFDSREGEASGEDVGGLVCSTVPVRCEYPGSSFLSPFLPQALEPDDTLRMIVHVTVAPGAPEALVNEASVSGGGAGEASVEKQNIVSSSPARFGASNFDFHISAANGARDTQAGAHPYELTTSIGLDNAVVANDPQGSDSEEGRDTSVQSVRDFVVDSPLGFVGSTLAAPECPIVQMATANGCPADTVIGHLLTLPQGTVAIDSPVWNLVPERGVPAEFGYLDTLGESHVLYVRVVPTSGGYVLQTTSPYVPLIDMDEVVLTLYGDPAAKQEELARLEGKTPSSLARIPFFTNPSGCSGEEPTATLYMDSWAHPAKLNADGTATDLEEPAWVKSESKSPAMTGCNALLFAPELLSKPTTEEADTPSGMELEMKFPQTENPEVNATSDLRNATVTFPAGFALNPASGDGLAACSEAQIGWLGGTPKNFNAAAPECPESSKVGSLEVTTPSIPRKLTGAMYVASQDENPYGSVIGLYVVVQDPITGVLVKLAGKTETNPQTGQITGVFEENPQLPINELKLSFFGGPRAVFATPNTCGTFQTTSDLEPWSAPDSGPDALPFAAFPITAGCVSGFDPAFTGSDTNLQAGAYSPFVASFSREDTDQELGGLTVSLPPGLSANLAGVPLCGEAQANAGTCPEASRIGTVLAESGPGPDPLPNTGKAYLTGPYNGGAFGMSVVVPAIAGPFNFGNVVVRQSLRIDPKTAQVTVVSDPFPTILHPKTTNARGEIEEDGIPIRLRRVQVTIERPGGQGFTFNPTSCSKLQVGGSITSTQGETKALETPFQVTNCASLKFTPGVAVSTGGRASKVNGAGLNFKISYPAGAVGSQSWFNEAKFTLPRQLPARLGTIQQACLAATFEHERSRCPAHSVIGHAVVHTQILPVPLEGPVYFVSYGGLKFPEAVMVLDGYGVHIELHGETYIDNKTGITSATFHNTPDVPFESIEVNIPTGPFSEFGANVPAKDNYSLCGQKLVMPTLFKAQNGLEVSQNTNIAITGCAKPKTRAQLLAAALRACHKKKGHNRAVCENAARNAHGARKATAKKSTHTGHQ